MKVYIAFRYSSESQCPPDITEVIGVFDSEEKARKCIEKCTTDIRKFKSTKDEGNSISYSCGDWYNEYYYQCHEVK